MRIWVIVCVLVTLSAAGIAAGADAQSAQSKYKACSLLTASELETLLRNKVDRFSETDQTVNDGPWKGETMSTCTWFLGRTEAQLSVIRAPRSPEERAVGMARLREAEETLRKQGWTTETVTVAGAECKIATPPASANVPGRLSACLAEAKGLALLLIVGKPAAPVDVTAQQVKALADKAVARLP
ncbi:MAG TPA: hypothetical protein VFM39_01070 [bacterium]|nr:hypothetical protein [bacterium]